MKSFLEFLEDSEFDVDRFYVDKFYSSIKFGNWILIDTEVLKWLGYHSENKEYKLKQRFLVLLQKKFKIEEDYKILNKKEFNVMDKQRINIMFSSNFSKDGNKTKYLIISPRCFEEILFIINTTMSYIIRKIYINLASYFNDYLRQKTISTINKLKKENEKLKKIQSINTITNLDTYKPLERNKYIYVLSNKSYMSQNLFKIGHTSCLEDYITKGKINSSYDEMRLIYHMKVFNGLSMEDMIYDKLEQFRHAEVGFFHINYNMLMDLMKEFERMEFENTKNFNSIISKYRPEDIQQLDLSSDIEKISKEAEAMLEKSLV